MYILNGIAYAGEPAKITKVVSVYPLDNFNLQVEFNDGKIKNFDFKPLLNDTCFVPLKDKALFEKVYIDYGVPTWDNGNIDISPEFLYENGVDIRGEQIA